MRISFVKTLLLFAMLSLVGASPAFAQRDLEVPIQFDFINPGARSLGLAGAFIGVADDATAATTNPAGLQRLARPEISVEGRGWQFITDFVEGGRLTGTATQLGIDTTNEPRFGETKERVGGLSFLSVVYPRGQWSFAGYRQEASRLRSGAQTEGAFFTEPNENNQLQDFREFPSIVDRSLDVINYGGTVAVRQGIVSVGAGIHFSQLDFESGLVGFELPDNFYAAATYDEGRYAGVQISDDWGVGFSAGVMVVPNNQWQFGVSFRRNAGFDYEGEFEYPDFPELTGTYEGEFKVPDNFGVGMAVRPFDGLTVALDVNRVFYSDLVDFLQSQVIFFEEDRFLYTIDDATEVHVGAEYVFTGMRFLPAVRGGFWRESEHSVNYGGTDPLYTASASLAKGTSHFAVGAGVAPSRRFEFNAGFDFSDRANTMSFSAIVRF
jgi:long-chain fatty acid transport protein